MVRDSLNKTLTRDGCTDYFIIDVGLHQGSALSPLAVIRTIDVLASELGSTVQSNLRMISRGIKEQQKLEKWSDQSERQGLQQN